MSDESKFRFVFLDFDGVLAPFRSLHASVNTCQDILPPHGCLQFDPECVAELNHLCLAAQATIVISSSWRHYIKDLETMRKMLCSQGVNAAVSGMVPTAKEDWKDYSRGAEVRAFMEPLEVERYVILDDADMGWSKLDHAWVQPDCRLGLQAGDVRQALAILNE